MIETLGLAIRGGFGLVVGCLIPVFAVAAIAAVIVALLGGALGVRDGALGQIVRALAVILALGVLIERIAAGVVEFAATSWASVGEDR